MSEIMIDKQHLRKGTKKRSGHIIRPTHITIHSVGNWKSTIQNERDYLENPNNTGYTGWHFVVGDSKIIEAIPPNERAWHAGNTFANNYSIGIEMIETGNREKVIENTVWLTKKLMKDFNINDGNVVQHRHWTNTNCPRILMGDKWIDFKTRIRIKEEGLVMNKANEKRVREIVQEEIAKVNRGQEVPTWAKEAVDYVKKEKIMVGDTDDGENFNPNKNVTRAELAEVIYRLSNQK